MKKAAELWKALFDQRYAWAFQAYDGFMDALNPDVRERMGHKSADEEAYVVVFGRTQVGKTTLLLDLMGVSPEHLPRVSTVLRGGREAGRSATATAMEYRRSADRRWGLQVENQTRWFDDDCAMTGALGELRASMEHRDLQVRNPCVIYVPVSCFNAGSELLQTRMLDLPGDQPSNEAEREHVHAMAKQYIPLADLVLLVARSDDLTSLQPGRLTLPGIENWQSVPNKFRVVTTFSFEPADVRDAMRKITSPNIDDIRTELIIQIEKAGALSPQARNPEWFFPLEFGDSWKSGLDQERELYDRVAPIIMEFKQTLLHQIRESTGQWARLKNATSAHAIAIQVMQERLESADEELKARQDALRKDEDDSKRVKSALQKVITEARDLRKSIPPTDWFKENITLNYPEPPNDNHINGNVRDFRAAIFGIEQHLTRLPDLPRFTEKLETKASRDPNEWSKFLSRVRNQYAKKDTSGLKTDIQRAVRQSFEQLSSKLNSYSWDTYWSALPGSNYATDLHDFNLSRRTAQKKAQALVDDWWRDIALDEQKCMEDKAMELDRKAISRERLLGQLRKEQESLKVEIAKTSVRLDQLRIEMEKDLASSRCFAQMLDGSYLRQLRARRLAIINGTSPAVRVLNLLAAVQLKQARAKLLHSVDSAPPNVATGKHNQGLSS